MVFCVEKPDIVDKFCRREIPVKNPELKELALTHFGKMYEPMQGRKAAQQQDDETMDTQENCDIEENPDADDDDNENPWKDEEDRIANFYITTNSLYNHKRLPNIIKIKDCQPGEVPIWKKRSFPKAARVHKKKEDTDPHRFFLSELILYKGFTDENDLGCNDQDKCRKIYLDNFEAIQFVKSRMMPFAQGVEEARYHVELAKQSEGQVSGNIGEVLDPEQEQEIEECQEGEENPHPDFVQLNPDQLEFDNNLKQSRNTVRKIKNQN